MITSRLPPTQWYFCSLLLSLRSSSLWHDIDLYKSFLSPQTSLIYIVLLIFSDFLDFSNFLELYYLIILSPRSIYGLILLLLCHFLYSIFLLANPYSKYSTKQMISFNLDKISSEVFVHCQPDPWVNPLARSQASLIPRGSTFVPLLSFETDTDATSCCFLYIFTLEMLSLEVFVSPFLEMHSLKARLIVNHKSHDLTFCSHLSAQGSHFRCLLGVSVSL